MSFAAVVAAAASLPATATAVYDGFGIQLVAEGNVLLICKPAGESNRGWFSHVWAASKKSTPRGKQQMTEASLRESMRRDARALADHCIVGWERVVESEAPTVAAPFSPDKCYELLCVIIESTDGLTEFGVFNRWIQDKDNFREERELPSIVDVGKP